MKIGMIGAGKVGFSLGKLFAEGGVELMGYYSRSVQSASEAAAFTNSRYYENLYDFAEDCDAIFITVPDNAIRAVFQQIRRLNIQGKYICHCSGSLSAADAFPGIAETGARGVSVHPLFPVSSKYTVWQELSGAFFCLEGDEEAVSVFSSLLGSLGISVQIIPSESKARYHVGCVMASNFMCALVQESIDLLAGCGFTQTTAVQALMPLLRSNLEHILDVGPTDALTGPVERQDTGTVERHLSALADDPARQLLYRLLSEELVEIARKKHPAQDYEPMSDLLRLTEKRSVPPQ